MKTKRIIIWKNIPEYEGRYKINNKGTVCSLARKVRNKNGIRKVKRKILKQASDNSGYLQVLLSKNGHQKTFNVHFLVAKTFLNHVSCGHKLVVNHKDFDKTNNCIENLEITSQRKNTNRKHLRHTSQFTGVSWDKKLKKWRAQIYNNKVINLGTYSSELKAAEVYKKALAEI